MRPRAKPNAVAFNVNKGKGAQSAARGSSYLQSATGQGDTQSPFPREALL